MKKDGFQMRSFASAQDDYLPFLEREMSATCYKQVGPDYNLALLSLTRY